MRLSLVNLEYSQSFSDGDESIELRLCPLDFLEKAKLGDLVSSSGLADALRHLLQCTVRDWKGVEDATGKPVPFDQDRLAILMGQRPNLARQIQDHLTDRNELKADKGPSSPL